MSLFRKPTARRVGLKVLVTGNTGSGKSVFALTFPKIFAIDSEAGLALYENNRFGQNLLGIANTQSFRDLEKAAKEVTSLVKSDENSVGSVVIDSETKFYQNLQETCMTVEENRARKSGRDVMDANLSQRSWGKIKQISTKLQNIKIDLSTKGVNIISVSQVEDVKEKQGESFVKVGEKPVAAKNIEYDYDIVINLFTELDGNGDVIYKGQIKKDRTGKTNVGDIIDNPSYSLWAEEGKGEVVESNFQDDVKHDIEEIETAEKEDAPEPTVNTETLVAEITKLKLKADKENKSKSEKAVAYIKSKGGKIRELNVNDLQEVIKILK